MTVTIISINMCICVVVAIVDKHTTFFCYFSSSQYVCVFTLHIISTKTQIFCVSVVPPPLCDVRFFPASSVYYHSSYFILDYAYLLPTFISFYGRPTAIRTSTELFHSHLRQCHASLRHQGQVAQSLLEEYAYFLPTFVSSSYQRRKHLLYTVLNLLSCKLRSLRLQSSVDLTVLM